MYIYHFAFVVGSTLVAAVNCTTVAGSDCLRIVGSVLVPFPWGPVGIPCAAFGWWGPAPPASACRVGQDPVETVPNRFGALELVRDRP